MRKVKTALFMQCVFLLCFSAYAIPQNNSDNAVEKYSDRYVGYTLRYNPDDWEFSYIDDDTTISLLMRDPSSVIKVIIWSGKDERQYSIKGTDTEFHDMINDMATQCNFAVAKNIKINDIDFKENSASCILKDCPLKIRQLVHNDEWGCVLISVKAPTNLSQDDLRKIDVLLREFNFEGRLSKDSTSTRCVDGLDVEKIAEAMKNAQSEKTFAERFYFELSDDNIFRDGLILLNNNSKKKEYGPYRIVYKGTPGERFKLYQFNSVNYINPSLVGTGYVDTTGQVWIRIGCDRIKLSEHTTSINNLYPGESFFALIVFEDKKNYLAARTIPNPLEAHGKDGRYVAMEFFSLNSPIYYVHGENFIPGEEIKYTVHCPDGVGTTTLTVEPEGTFFLLHGDNGQHELNSKEYIEISTSTQSEPMMIHFDWDCFRLYEDQVGHCPEPLPTSKEILHISPVVQE